jgi:hypothetical protein
MVQPTSEDAVKSVRLLFGDKAPWNGTLLSDTALAKLLTDASEKEKLLKLDITRLEKELSLEKYTAEIVCAARVGNEKLKYAACSKDADTVRNLLEKSVNPPWYSSTYFNFIMGSVVAGSICAATARVK